ncbi:hypothetical protein D3C71_2020310 [compost metagenome]
MQRVCNQVQLLPRHRHGVRLLGGGRGGEMIHKLPRADLGEAARCVVVHLDRFHANRLDLVLLPLMELEPFAY